MSVIRGTREPSGRPSCRRCAWGDARGPMARPCRFERFVCLPWRSWCCRCSRATRWLTTSSCSRTAGAFEGPSSKPTLERAPASSSKTARCDDSTLARSRPSATATLCRRRKNHRVSPRRAFLGLPRLGDMDIHPRPGIALQGLPTLGERTGNDCRGPWLPGGASDGARSARRKPRCWREDG